jgi:hypothetical protein
MTKSRRLPAVRGACPKAGPKLMQPSSEALPLPSALRPKAKGGGGERNRTDDLLLAKQALSQLSYTPDRGQRSPPPKGVVGLGRFELPTSRLSSARSNQLSYRPGSLPGRSRPAAPGHTVPAAPPLLVPAAPGRMEGIRRRRRASFVRCTGMTLVRTPRRYP